MSFFNQRYNDGLSPKRDQGSPKEPRAWCFYSATICPLSSIKSMLAWRQPKTKQKPQPPSISPGLCPSFIQPGGAVCPFLDHKLPTDKGSSGALLLSQPSPDAALCLTSLWRGAVDFSGLFCWRGFLEGGKKTEFSVVIYNSIFFIVRQGHFDIYYLWTYWTWSI